MAVAAYSARWALVAVLIAAVSGVAWDVTRPPQRQRSVVLALTAVHAYQRLIAPQLNQMGVRCRFTPTCSLYAEAALRRDGLIGGIWRSVRRIARCGPWTPPGTVDPLPSTVE